MKHAQLWTRILNDGIYDDLTDQIGRHVKTADLQMRIITAPIISCRYRIDLPREHAHSAAKLSDDLAGLPPVAPPFNSFWLDLDELTPKCLCGDLVSVSRWSDRFVYNVSLVMTGQKNQAFRVCEYRFATDLQGRFIPGSHSARGGISSKRAGAYFPHGFVNNDLGQGIEHLAVTDAGAILTILGLLSCRNVGLKAIDGNPLHVERAKREWGGEHDYKYHVLIVRPAGAGEDHPGVELDVMPFHACRGHFKEYGPEFGKKMLFGRLSGRFYIAPHMRGKREHGIVSKDYLIREAS